MKAALITLGCKVNSYDTQRILADLKENGYTIVPPDEYADVYIVNTCAVTNESERKSRQMIRKAKSLNPGGIVVVTGCYPQTAMEEVQKITEADIITGTHNRDQIPMLIQSYQNSRIADIGDSLTPEPLLTHFEEKTRAVLKIQDGCRMFCAYCIIPYARGEIRCAQSSEVLAAVNDICANGYHEAVLTGIHLASYFDGEMRLIELLEAIGSQTSLKRLRLGSLEPKLLTEDFLARLSAVRCFCPHFHISLQSGSDTVLRLMNRRYTADEYTRVVDLVRRYFPDASVTTDIIVGFPGETDALFEETKAFVKKTGFAHVHVFPYSPKKGTPAADMDGQLSNAVKHARAAELIALSEQVRDDVLRSSIGKTFEVLTETTTPQGHPEGFTQNYLKMRLSPENRTLNTIYKARAMGIDNGVLTENE